MAAEATDLTRVAIISDIHGNLPAFQTVLAEVDRRGPFEFVVGGGDFVFGGAYPAEALALVRERQFDCVRGNTDEWIVELATGGRVPAQGYQPSERHAGQMAEVDSWAVERLDQALPGARLWQDG
jgi:predicted phosphodiesterase